MKFRNQIFAVSLMMMATVAMGAENEPKVIETWRCYGSLDFVTTGEPLVTLLRYDNQVVDGLTWSNGEITVTGLTPNTAKFGAAGINRRWDWGVDSVSSYAFIISPDGEGKYYDFGFANDDGNAVPRQFFNCKMSRP